MDTMNLTNLLNGKTAPCVVRIPCYSACYAHHGALLEWARKTGCARLLKRVWDGADVEPFIAIDGDTACGFAIYRNPKEDAGYYRDYVTDDDDLAFWAIENGESENTAAA